MPFDCNMYPALFLKGNKCQVVHGMSFFQIDLTKLIDGYSSYGYGHGIHWSMYERIVWIGYHKNETNMDCFLATLSKDLIKYLLSYLVCRCGYC